MKPKDDSGLLRLPVKTNLYFWARGLAIRSVRGAIWVGTKLRWPWLVFNLMALQRRNGWRFEQ